MNLLEIHEVYDLRFHQVTYLLHLSKREVSPTGMFSSYERRSRLDILLLNTALCGQNLVCVLVGFFSFHMHEVTRVFRNYRLIYLHE